MFTSLLLVIVGLVGGFWGSTKFNYFIMFGGWILAGVGCAVFLSHLLALP